MVFQMFLSPEISLSHISGPSLQFPLLEDLCCQREIHCWLSGAVPESSKGLDSQFSRAGNVGKLLLNVPRFCPEGAVAGVREGINSLWFLDSAECHTGTQFGYGQPIGPLFIWGKQMTCHTRYSRC